MDAAKIFLFPFSAHVLANSLERDVEYASETQSPAGGERSGRRHRSQGQGFLGPAACLPAARSTLSNYVNLLSLSLIALLKGKLIVVFSHASVCYFYQQHINKYLATISLLLNRR